MVQIKCKNLIINYLITFLPSLCIILFSVNTPANRLCFTWNLWYDRRRRTRSLWNIHWNLVSKKWWDNCTTMYHNMLPVSKIRVKLLSLFAQNTFGQGSISKKVHFPSESSKLRWMHGRIAWYLKFQKKYNYLFAMSFHPNFFW